MTRTAAACLACCLLIAAGPGAGSPARAAAPAAYEPLALSPVAESVPARRIDGEPYIGANDLARLLDARRAWRADVRRLTLTAGRHRVEFIVENPFAVVDSSIVRLPYPARTVGGEMLVPAAVVDTLPRDPALPRLLYDPQRDAVVVLPPGGVVRALRFTAADSVTRIVFAADRADDAILADRMRGHFRLRFGGYFAGAPPTIPAHGSLVLVLRPIGTASGCAFELEISPDAAGFRLTRDPAARRVTLEVVRAPGPGVEAFAPEGPALPPGTPTIVIDPGHGGDDEGVLAGGLEEKRLTLDLARLLRDELERRGIARVLLTRDDDRTLPAHVRAEVANHARAELFLSLHFDGFPGRSRGATVWCAPARSPAAATPPDPVPVRATGSARPRRGARAAGAARALAPPLVLVPWADATLPYAHRSRALAEALRSALTLRDLGPVRVREFVPEPLLGVDAPAVVLECATLTSPADADRLRSPRGMRALAATLADAVAAWRRSD